MTRSEVERTQRTSATRFGLRVLVVGGFAGAAWLLSAASAHAAEANLPAEDAPTEMSVVSSLVSGSGNGADERSSLVTPLTDTLDPALSPVTGVASAVTGGALPSASRASAVVLPSTTVTSTTPLRSASAGAAGQDAGAASGNAASAPARAATPASAPQTGAATGGGVLSGLAGALVGPSGLLSPVTRVVNPVVAPLTGTLRPVTGVLLNAAQPVTSTLGSVTRTATGALTRSGGQRTQLPAPAGAPVSDTAAATVVTGTQTPVFGPRKQDGYSGSTSTTSVHRYEAGTEHSATGTPEPRTGSGNLPDRPYPAPLRGYIGAGAGTPASGLGSHMEGGAFAVVPSSVVQRAVATHRMPVTTDVEARRNDAEAPTVSPD
ncbi:hypothetical protein [Phytohabitans aurantiacus]|jgi:hypothetical protein|uniref:Uncharacterized protein n=1 Tax=Phytohabitans aurantiacus TaxID=3016789 RepID=A0ABQ5QKT2_9ACTN|nr:hypothetical protein [Phytohabitans aurantiacus]GLH95276.1 hypothetical protein Pa4123_05480 [Phytohabitans aurantiacus]